MRSPRSLKGIVAGLVLIGLAVATPASQRDSLRDRAAGSCHTATNRRCWSDGFDINTDFEASIPTGQKRQINLEVSEYDNWIGPDGVMKEKVMLINGQLPGPTIFADWGDELEITVTNNLVWNGTSFHWHGMRQKGSNIMDGTNGVTECPIPGKGGSRTYKFRATQYGTAWYHSHFSAQYGNGVAGAMVIRGPSSDNYDIDLGVLAITDYYHRTAEDIVHETLRVPGAPPLSDNVLFNGLNINPSAPGGSYFNMTLTPNRRHLLRLVNPSVENHFQVSLVGHDMTVVSTDLVPVNSFTTNNLFMGVGQRYDVIINASQAIGNYWFNVTFSSTGLCGGSRNPAPAAIFRYAGAPVGLPTNRGTPPPDARCHDSVDFVPVISRGVPTADFTPAVDNTLPVTLDPNSSLVTWLVNGSAIHVDWEKPVLDYVLTGNTSYPTSENLIPVDKQDEWYIWVIQNLGTIPHPMHLHGHDFVILGHSGPAASFTSPVETFTRDKLRPVSNPTRRDVAMLPGAGWLVIAFKSDNPGAWLFHCHIAWHVSGGLSVDFLERVGEQAALVSPADRDDFNANCAKWSAFYALSPFRQDDSGLRGPPQGHISGV